MTGIILNGCCGKMGKAVYNQSLADDGVKIIAGVDIAVTPDMPFPCYSAWQSIPQEIIKSTGVIVDFSNPIALGGLLEFAVANSLPAVIATTGFNDAQVGLIKAASKRIPVFFTANMSLGVNLLAELAKKAARVLGGSFDIEIVEMHHNQKLDSPSGTALMLADAINEEFSGSLEYEYDRHTKREKRPRGEIGIHSIRGGTVTGEHQIIFAGHDEVITLSHSARSKELFATGALSAAVFIDGRQSGLYTMADILG